MESLMIRTLVAALALTLAPLALAAQERTERVSFAAGASSATLGGRITGDETVLYVAGASAGQTMSVRLSGSTSAYFNIYAPGTGPGDAALAIGELLPEVNVFSDVLPESGDYQISVFLVRAVARRGESADYTLDIAIGDTAAAPGGDVADGLSGGPDYWEVAVSGSLNVRDAPSTSAKVLVAYLPGTVVRNLGCEEAEGRRWCRIEAPDGALQGWVAGQFLREAAAPAGATTDALVPGTPFNATGEIACTLAGGAAASCPFGVIRKGGGAATVVVTLPDGTARSLEFAADGSVTSDRGAAVTVRRDGDRIEVGDGADVFEMVDAILSGG
jgi:hypothetical protein